MLMTSQPTIGVLVLLHVVATLGSTQAQTFRGTLLEAALHLREKFDLAIAVDPELLDAENLRRSLPITGETSEAALLAFTQALAPDGISLKKVGELHWITSSTPEADRGSEIDGLLSTKSYGQLMKQLQRAAVSNPRAAQLLQMAALLAGSEQTYVETQQFITSYGSRIKGLDFQIRSAESGTALRKPDFNEARRLASTRDELQSEVNQRIDAAMATLIAASQTPPPEILQLYDSVPEVVFKKMYLDYLIRLLRTYELFVSSANKLGFEFTIKAQTGLKTDIESIRSALVKNSSEVIEYRTLLQTAGLQAAVPGAPTPASSSQAALEALLRLADFHNDRREKVRMATGERIVSNLSESVKELRQPSTEFSSALISKPAYLLDANDCEAAKRFLAEAKVPTPLVPPPYAAETRDRIGAVTGLVVGGNRGATQTLSIEFAPRTLYGEAPKTSLQNVFASREKQVSLHTTDESALLDSSFRAAIKDALDLVESKYVPTLFQSQISLAFDSTTGIAVGGDSAGVALTLATLSQSFQRPLDRRIAVTGAIRRFGDVRAVGGVYYKAQAALGEGTLALIVPAQNADSVYYLPASQLLAANIFAISDVREACGIVQFGEAKDNQAAIRGAKLHGLAVLCLANRFSGEALTLAEASLAAFPTHLSSRILSSLLRAAEVTPATSDLVTKLLAHVDSRLKTIPASQPTVAVVAHIAKAKTADKPAVPSPVAPPILPGMPPGPATTTPSTSSVAAGPMDIPIAEFVIQGESGATAITKLIAHIKTHSDRTIDVVVREKEKTELSSTELHLDLRATTSGAILRKICLLSNCSVVEEQGVVIIAPLAPKF